MIVPQAGRSRRGNGDASLALLLHPVHRRGAFMHLADAVNTTGIKEDALSGRRFARINMGDDADIARTLERRLRLLHICLVAVPVLI